MMNELLKVEKIRFKINGYGTTTKIINLYIDLCSLTSTQIKVLEVKMLDNKKNYDCLYYGHRFISSAKSLNIWFSEENISVQEIQQVLVDFISTSNLSLLYINDKRDSLRYLASIFIKYIDVAGAYLEDI